MSAGHGMNQKELEAFQKKFGFGEQKIIELRHAFEAVDKDSSGAISVEEIAEVMRDFKSDISMEELKTLVQRIDTDGNGELDFEEFVGLMSSLQTPIFDAEMKHAFKVFDADKDGFISFEELTAVAMKSQSMCNLTLNADEVMEMLDEADLDNDGKISYEEFYAMMHY